MDKNKAGKQNGIGILFKERPKKSEEWDMQISSGEVL